MGLSQYRLARNISVPPRRINEIVHGKRAIAADTALRLSRFFGASEQFWLNLQTAYDLELPKDYRGDRHDREVTGHAPTSQRRARAARLNSEGPVLCAARRCPAATRRGAESGVTTALAQRAQLARPAGGEGGAA